MKAKKPRGITQKVKIDVTDDLYWKEPLIRHLKRVGSLTAHELATLQFMNKGMELIREAYVSWTSGYDGLYKALLYGAGNTATATNSYNGYGDNIWIQQMGQQQQQQQYLQANQKIRMAFSVPPGPDPGRVSYPDPPLPLGQTPGGCRIPTRRRRLTRSGNCVTTTSTGSWMSSRG